jgi:hypothetical protein
MIIQQDIDKLRIAPSVNTNLGIIRVTKRGYVCNVIISGLVQAIRVLASHAAAPYGGFARGGGS